MKKAFCALLIASALAVSMMFTGCAEFFSIMLFAGDENSDIYSEAYSDADDEIYGEGSGEGFWDDDNGNQSFGDYRPQGSVNLVAGKTVMVTVFVGDENNEWTDEESQYVAYAQKTAAEYIMAQAKSCGKTSEIITWSEENSDLAYDVNIDNVYNESRDDSTSEYIDLIQGEIDLLPISDIEQKYGTDSIGFIVVLDTPGNSYAFPYSAYDEGYCYNEFVTMYMYDESSDYGVYESVPAYAHEILHLFGAVDLYKAVESDGVTEEVYEYASENLQGALMYTTYEPDESGSTTGVSQYLSDITLAMTGLIADNEVVAQFPSLKREYIASFGAQAAS